MFKLSKRMKNSPMFVHVFHKTLNLAISHYCFAEEKAEIVYQIHNSRVEPLFLLIKSFCFVAFALPSPSSLLEFPGSCLAEYREKMYQNL